MTRREDWPARLLEQIEAAAAEPFVWGSWDCGQWVGKVCEAMSLTGHNPMEPWRGRYTTELGMRRILARDFGGDLVAFWTSVLGEPVELLTAGRGDAVVVEHDGDQASGIIDTSGERIAVLTLDGLEYLPLTAARAAWRL